MSARAIPPHAVPAVRHESDTRVSPLPPFELTVAVQGGDIDELQHVNNVVYLAWVQDVAIAHWNSLTSEQDRAALAWVALRHEIDYKSAAVLGDTVIARTWTGVAKGLRYSRHTEIIRASDGALLVQALSHWCPIERQSGRPMRLPAKMAAFFAKEQ